MKTYKLDYSSAKLDVFTSLKEKWPLLVLVMLVGVAIPFLNDSFESIDLTPLLLVIPLTLLAIFLGLRNGIARNNQLLASYELHTDGETFIRHQFNTPSLELNKEEIAAIFEDERGNISLLSQKNGREIHIPFHIQERDELLDILLDIDIIQKQGREQSMQLNYLTYFSIALMGLVFMVNEPSIVIPGGIILLGLLGWSYREVRNNQSIDLRTKRLMNWAFVPMGATLLKVVFTVLMSMGIVYVN